MNQERELPQIATTMMSNYRAIAHSYDWKANNLFALVTAQALAQKPVSQKGKDEKMTDTITRRLVQVFIADPDPNVPLEKALLYSGTQQMTDLSDQELFFEIDIAGILKKHNEERITLTDKSIKSKTVHLEPVRIRDLRMTVVTIASF